MLLFIFWPLNPLYIEWQFLLCLFSLSSMGEVQKKWQQPVMTSSCCRPSFFCFSGVIHGSRGCTSCAEKSLGDWFLMWGTAGQWRNFTSTFVFWTQAYKLGRVVRTNAFEVVFRVRYWVPHVCEEHRVFLLHPSDGMALLFVFFVFSLISLPTGLMPVSSSSSCFFCL